MLKDFVHVTAIESNAGGEDFMWRAISILPHSNCRSFVSNTGLLPSLSHSRFQNENSKIIIEKTSDFGIVEIGTEKELKIEIINVDSVEHALINVRFLNIQSNFQLCDQSFPIIVAENSKIFVDVIFK